MLRTLGERQDVNYDLKGSGDRFGVLRPVPYSALRGGSSSGVGEAWKSKLRKLQAYACSMRGANIMGVLRGRKGADVKMGERGKSCGIIPHSLVVWVVSGSYPLCWRVWTW